MILTDSFGRIHDYVRISLIDKCNLNCIYCNPKNYLSNSFQKESILSYEELIRLIKILVRDLGVKKIRFTGGEPLIRKDILHFFKMLTELGKEYLFDIGITTNGTHLEDKIESLYSCGINKLNISLDTLQRSKFLAITGKDLFETTLRSIEKATQLNFKSVKVNSVIIKNTNDDELIDFVEHFKSTNINLRFIEYMPFAGNQWDDTKFVSWEEMKSAIEKKYSLFEISSEGKVSKDYFVDGNNLRLGFISSISNHFCGSCNRLRITASGKIKNCLFSTAQEINLKRMLKDPYQTDNLIAQVISNSIQGKWFQHPNANELANLQHNSMMSIGG